MAKAADKAYEAIRSRILEGGYPSGSHLREGDIAEQVGVSRTPVREALRRLSAEGYVDFKPNRGTFVAEWTERSISDLIDVRTELAAMAGRRAASRVRHEDLEILVRLNREMATLAERRPPGYLTAVSMLNLEFHGVILRCADNTWLQSLMQQTAYLPMVQRAQHGYEASDWQRAFAHYTELIDALSSGDAEWAATALRSHFLASKHAAVRRRPQSP
jgi:DNA-binding GntR family transcriptional regulator